MKLQILLEIFFPEDNLIRFEILKAIWDLPGNNNDDENNNDATFLAKLFCIILSKNGMNKVNTIGKGCELHNG